MNGVQKLWLQYWKLISSYFFLGVGGLVVVSLLFTWWDGSATLGAVLGFLSGWATGILLAPYEEEQRRFGKLSKAISGFIAGFAAGKADRIFDLAVDERTHGALILDAHFTRPFFIAIACFLLTIIAVFVSRTYEWPMNAD
ncbi:MAG TPA: hypothetical protein VJN43_01760 [Bryobacteraceae bacterium]|nr:hypothetical protein [Bryobacteraceae bacterium]